MPEIEFINTDDRAPLTVLLSIAPPDGTTRFVNQIVEEAPPELNFRFFSWQEALLGRYDVFHVHWPEFLVRHSNPLVRTARIALLGLLLVRLKRSGVPIVRTLHNLRAHEDGGATEARVLDRIERQTTLFIRLNRATPLEHRPGVTILHGHYRGRYSGMGEVVLRPGTILYFGLIRPYKGVETLLNVFAGMPDRDLSLRLVGKPDKNLRRLIESHCASDPRISSELEFVPDDRLALNVLRAELVVLPYKAMHNSGAILVALSLARPVVVPRSHSNELLANEVGPGWVHMFDGELTETILREALAQARTANINPPRLEGRDWQVVGEAHYRAYRTANAQLPTAG